MWGKNDAHFWMCFLMLFLEFLGFSSFLICSFVFTFLLFYFFCLALSWMFPMSHNKMLSERNRSVV